MKEIKFRYRFKNRKSDETITQICDIGNIENRAFTPNPFGSLEWKILSRDQWTGLKDKNGKEIYEGDIVQYSYRGLIEKRTVRYDEQSASFQMDISDYVLDQEGSYPEDLEVIGNVYENSSLPTESVGR